MKYDVTLKIAYDYPSAVAVARHTLRVRPRTLAGQTIETTTVKIVPNPDERFSDLDFYGNPLDEIVLARPHETLRIEMRARIDVAPELAGLAGTPTLAAVADEARRTRDASGLSPIHFLGRSRRIGPLRNVSDYTADGLRSPYLPVDGLPADGALAASDRDPSTGSHSAGEAVMALTRKIKADFAYQPGATKVGTSVAEAFEKRHGVCQDFAHVMIAGLRANGIPAAYVSGFLRTLPPPGKPRLQGADAMHAWVTVWLGRETGWVGFDPTNAVMAGSDHIVVAIGRDYSDVSPVAGVLTMTGSQKTRHSVDVVPVEPVEAAPIASPPPSASPQDRAASAQATAAASATGQPLPDRTG